MRSVTRRTFFMKLPIKHKIIRIFLPLILVPLLLLGAVSYFLFSKALIENARQSTYNESILITTSIESVLTNTEYTANAIAHHLNGIYEEANHSKTKDALQRTLYEENLRNSITKELALNLNSNLDCLIFIDNFNELYSSKRILNSTDTTILSESIKKELEASDGQNIWFPMANYYCISNTCNEPAVLVGKKVMKGFSSETLGFLLIRINESSFCDLYSNLSSDSKAKRYFIDRNGTIVSSINKKELFQTITPTKQEEISNIEKPLSYDAYTNQMNAPFITNVPIPRLGWTFVNEKTLADIPSESFSALNFIVILMLVCGLCTYLAARKLSNSIAVPLTELTSQMKQVQSGNFNVHFQTDLEDEIGILVCGFNNMTQQIQNLLHNIQMEQAQKREYELSLMQAQIKPHFLYNTLDIIYILCKMGKSEEGKNITKSLADYYRIVLSSGNEIIPLREEIKNLRSYLVIQHSRYEDVFNYSININHLLLNCKIPKLTLQPLVENAIYHGLKPADHRGHLEISGEKYEDCIVIKIIDNGIGIPAEKQLALLKPPSPSSKHFGIRNVHERIQLYFGSDYGLTVENMKTGGTIVTVTIPLSS